MSSDRRTAGHLHAADGTPVDPGLAGLVRLRGGPLLEALEERRPGARRAADAAGAYALAGAAGLGLDRGEAELCRETAKLAEVGLLYAPVALLAKPREELTAEQLETLESHYEAGARLLVGAGVPELVSGWILRSRERYDGGGPGGLAGGEIPLVSKITRAARTCEEELAKAGGGAGVGGAIARLRAAAGTELDPEVVEALTEVLGRSAA